MKSIVNYLNSVKAEVKNISWPTQKITTLLTIGVIMVSIVVIIYLGLLDSVFMKIVEILIIK